MKAIIAICRWGNWGSERWGDFLKITLVKWPSLTETSENFCFMKAFRANSSPQDEIGFNYRCIRLKNHVPANSARGLIVISTAGHLGVTHQLGLKPVGESIRLLIEILFPCISFHYLSPSEIQAIRKTQLGLQKLKYPCSDLQEATASQNIVCWWSCRLAHLLPFRRQWHPTPVLLPGKSHGRRSLVGCSPCGP